MTGGETKEELRLGGWGREGRRGREGELDGWWDFETDEGGTLSRVCLSSFLGMDGEDTEL